MEEHIILIIRYLVCLFAIVGGLTAMIKAADNNILRRCSFAIAIGLVYLNPMAGSILYLLIGSTLESLVAVMGVTFFIISLVVIVLLPVIAVVRWVIH